MFLGSTGKRFWQNESHDHLVRTPAEFQRVKRYIENNPVKAGLVSEPHDFLWSSARPAQSGLQPKLAALQGGSQAIIAPQVPRTTTTAPDRDAPGEPSYRNTP
jgi:putative DNA methylase